MFLLKVGNFCHVLVVDALAVTFGSFLLCVSPSQRLTARSITSFASDTGGPLMEICNKESNMLSFNEFRSLVFILFNALAPFSGQTGSGLQQTTSPGLKTLL